MMEQAKAQSSNFDGLWSVSMEKFEIFRDFFKHYLPNHISKQVHLDTFKYNDRIKTNPKLQKHHKDITYQAQMKDGDTLLVNVEHQSKPDIMMPIRFLQYGTDSIAPYFRKHKKIPLLIQLLLYHGETSPYPYHTTLEDYYKHPAWGSQELTLRFYLIDLTQISDAELLKHGHCAPMELLLKHGRDGNFELPTDAYRSVFQGCIAAVGDDYIIAMLNYAAALSKAKVGEKIFEFIEEVLTNKTDVIMTYGQQLELRGEKRGIEQGMQQGMQQGRQEEKLGIARNMLHRLHLGVELVEQATGLSKQELASL